MQLFFEISLFLSLSHGTYLLLLSQFAIRTNERCNFAGDCAMRESYSLPLALNTSSFIFAEETNRASSSSSHRYVAHDEVERIEK